MREGNKDTVDLQVFVGLCPDCDKIHLILEVDGEQIFSQGLPDELWNAMFSGNAGYLPATIAQQLRRPEEKVAAILETCQGDLRRR